jgi:hypothetical protein
MARVGRSPISHRSENEPPDRLAAFGVHVALEKITPSSRSRKAGAARSNSDGNGSPATSRHVPHSLIEQLGVHFRAHIQFTSDGLVDGDAIALRGVDSHHLID